MLESTHQTATLDALIARRCRLDIVASTALRRLFHRLVQRIQAVEDAAARHFSQSLSSANTLPSMLKRPGPMKLPALSGSAPRKAREMNNGLAIHRTVCPWVSRAARSKRRRVRAPCHLQAATRLCCTSFARYQLHGLPCRIPVGSLCKLMAALFGEQVG